MTFQPLSWRTFLITAGILSQLTGCGGGSSDSTLGASTSTDTGTLQLAITDAEEDFLTYKVKVNAVNLIRKDGASVSLLPLSSDVDFVQYQELSELFAAASVPAGNYEKVTLKLDYADADIVIQDEAGTSYSAKAVDTEGKAVTQLDVEMNLTGDNNLQITKGKISRLTLDFDLAASNTIKSFSPAEVQVEPFLLATAELDKDREHRVRGLLAATDTSASSFTLALRPMRLKTGEFGQFKVHTSDATQYEINGIEYSGSAGFTALAALAADTPVVTFGQHQSTTDTFTASKVEAGSSVAWAGKDVLKGLVTARNGNEITLRGAVIEAEGKAAHFTKTLKLTLGDSTPVHGYRLGDASIANLSIGQQILALGSYSQSGFDATEGLVRMKLNRVTGQVKTLEPFVVDVASINRRPVSLFDFSGTGSDSSTNADPDNYEVDYRTLDISTLKASDWVQLRGYPTAFGSAPKDFDALSLVSANPNKHKAMLMSQCGKKASANSSACVSVSAGALQLSSTASARLHITGIPAVQTRELPVSTITGASGEGRYAIQQKGKAIDLYRQFSDFSAALELKLAEGAKVERVTATGQYDQTTQTLSAQGCTVKL